jgi:hypothetical protein
MTAPPTYPISTLRVCAWLDPAVDAAGHDVRSAYVEQFWLGVLGPSATWLLRRLVRGLDEQPDGYELDLALTATQLGLGHRSGRHSPFYRSLERLSRFGAAQHLDEHTLRVRRKLPPLSHLQVARLPLPQQEAHQAWIDGPTTTLPADQLRERARGLALSLLELGEDPDTTERQLHTWRLHPALAHDAVAWALQRHQVTRQIPRNDLPPEAA